MDQRRADAAARKLLRERLSGQERERLAADHVDAGAFVHLLVGVRQKVCHRARARIRQDNLTVVDEALALLADLLAGFLDVLHDLLLHYLLDVLRSRRRPATTSSNSCLS